MKKLFLMLTLMGSMAYAQIDPKEFEQGPVERSIPEDTMIYLRNGQSVGRFGDAQAITMNGFGYLRYAEHFIYGLEYNSFYSEEIDTRAKNLNGVVGYRVIWNKRFLPYGIFSFGHGNLVDESGQNRYGGNGIAVSLDLGMDVAKLWKVKWSVGIRQTQFSFTNKILPNASFTDIYLVTGFVF